MSISQLQFSQKASATVVRGGASANCANSDLKLTGRYIVEHWRDGKRINEWHFSNGIVNEGKNKNLGVMWNSATQITSWYMGLIDNAGYTALAATDTYDDIDQAGNGWDEFQNYTDPGNGDSATTRPAWDEAAPSAQSITNNSVTVYDITGTGTVKGLFLVGGVGTANVKGDHAAAGTLWATALFSGDVAVLASDQLKVTYTISA